jgi:hypothetical protein
MRNALLSTFLLGKGMRPVSNGPPGEPKELRDDEFGAGLEKTLSNNPDGAV